MTGYCATCGAQVKRERGAQGAVSPDGNLYCDGCRPTGSDTAEAAPSKPRSKAPPRPPASSSPGGPRATGGAQSPSTRIVVGAVLLVLVMLGVGLKLRPGGERDGRPPEEAVPRVEAPAHPAPAAAPVASSVPRVEPGADVTPEPPQPVKVPPPETKEPEVASKPPAREPEPGPKEEPPKGSPGVLSPNDLAAIRAAEGKSETVQGVVLSAAAAKSGKLFWISFSKDKDGFEAVIFEKHLSAFQKQFGDLSRALAGRSVSVHGKITTYKGRPQIVLDDPSQLELK